MMKNITLLVKPASGLCDMRCRYCFYKDVTKQREEKNAGIMSHETASRLIESAFSYVGEGGFVHFLFQGGEPLLAGLDFFRDFLAMEQALQIPGIHVTHSVQTNGVNLSPEWALFFKENHFLLGLSLDGTQEFHNRFRVDSEGKGFWQKACLALACLDHFQVETNLLCVVTGPAAQSSQEIYQSLKKLGTHPLQFIPCLDPLETAPQMHPYSLTSQAYGAFLKELFDCWYQDWISGEYVSIRFFDDCIRLILKMVPSSCAVGSCGHYLAVEGNGDLYPCDFFMLDEWCLGNLHSVSVSDALSSPVAVRFSEEGKQYEAACRNCSWFFLCRGGCRRNWQKNGSIPTYDYCESMKSFFRYAMPRLRAASQQFARMLF